MTITTRDFGVIELDEKEQLEFKAPILGFEDMKKYVLFSDDEAGPGLLWLQSVENSQVCFILLDPQEIGLQYTPEISEDVMELLGLQSPPLVRVVAVVPEDFRDTTVNLKSPVIINPENKWAAQVVLDADYPIRLPLFDKGDGTC